MFTYASLLYIFTIFLQIILFILIIYILTTFNSKIKKKLSYNYFKPTAFWKQILSDNNYL